MGINDIGKYVDLKTREEHGWALFKYNFEPERASYHGITNADLYHLVENEKNLEKRRMLDKVLWMTGDDGSKVLQSVSGGDHAYRSLALFVLRDDNKKKFDLHIASATQTRNLDWSGAAGAGVNGIGHGLVTMAACAAYPPCAASAPVVGALAAAIASVGVPAVATFADYGRGMDDVVTGYLASQWLEEGIIRKSLDGTFVIA